MLSEHEEQEILDSLSLLVRCIRSYGEGDRRAHLLDLTSLSSCVGGFLKGTGPVSITCTAHSLVVNGKVLQTRGGLSPLADLLARHRVTGFEWKPGLSREELSRWLDLLLYPTEPVGGLAQALRHSGVAHVAVVGRRKTGPLPEADSARPSRRPSTGRLKLPPAAPPRRATSEKLAPAAARARSGKLAQPPPESPPPDDTEHRQEVHDLAAQALKRALPKETMKLLALVRTTLPLGELLHKDPGLLVKSLEASDADDHHITIAAALVGQGRSSLPHLLHCISHSDNPRARASAMFALGRLVSDADILLTRRLMEGCPPEETTRLLEAMESAHMPWNNVLTALLHSPNSFTRRGAYAFFFRTESLARNVKIRLVSEALSADQPWLVADAVRAAGILRADELASKILAVLKRNFEKPGDTLLVQREVCYALGRLRCADALSALKAMVFPSLANKLVGFAQQPSIEREELRAAALWAIARLPQAQAREVVVRAAGGPDQALRAVARVALDLQFSSATSTDPEVLGLMES